MAVNIVEIKMLFSGAAEATAGLKATADQMGALADAGAGVARVEKPLVEAGKAAAGLGGQKAAVSGLAGALVGLGHAGAPVARVGKDLLLLAGTSGPIRGIATVVNSVTRAFSGLGRSGVDAAAGVEAVGAASEGSASGMDTANTAATFLGVNLQILQKVMKPLITVGGLAAVAFAAVGAAAFAMGAKTASAIEQLRNTASAVGTTTQNVQVLRRVFEDAGLGAETATTALQFLARAIGDNNSVLKQLGITTKDPLEAMLQLADAFRGSDDIAKKNLISTALLGRGIRESAGFFQNLRGEVNRVSAAMDLSGEKFDDLSIEKGARLDARLDNLRGSFRGTATIIGKELTPVTDFFTQVLEVMAQKASLAAQSLGVLRKQIQEAGRASREGVVRGPQEDPFKEAESGLLGKALNAAFAGLRKEAQLFRVELEKVKTSFAGKPKPELQRAINELIDRMAKGAQQAKEFRKIAGDALSGITTGEEKDKPLSDREERIRRLTRDSGFAREAVLRLLSAIELEERAEKRLAAIRELGLSAPGLGETMAPEGDSLAPFKRAESAAVSLVRKFGELREQLQHIGRAEELDGLADAIADAAGSGDFDAMAKLWSEATTQMGDDIEGFAKRVKDAFDKSAKEAEKARQRWLRMFDLKGASEGLREDMKELLAPAELLRETFGNILGAMENELGQSFANVISGTQSFKSALTNLWRAIKDAILQMIGVIIARVLAMLILLPILTAIFTAVTGNPVLGANLAGVAVTGGASRRSAAGSREDGASLNGAFGGVTNITNVYAYDARNTVAELVSPSGILRRAGERVAVVRTY